MKEEYITTVDLWIVIEILQWETWHIGEDHSREFYHLKEKFEKLRIYDYQIFDLEMGC